MLSKADTLGHIWIRCKDNQFIIIIFQITMGCSINWRDIFTRRRCSEPECVSSGLWCSFKLFYGHIGSLFPPQPYCNGDGPKYYLVSFSQALLLSLLTFTEVSYSKSSWLCTIVVVLTWCVQHRKWNSCIEKKRVYNILSPLSYCQKWGDLNKLCHFWTKCKSY